MIEEKASIQALFNRARALERNLKFEEARAIYERILRDNPGHQKASRALKSLTAAPSHVAPPTETDFKRVLTLAGSNLQQAEKEAARLCRRHPGQPALENLHGAVLSQLGAHQQAADAFERAIELKPGFTDAMNNLAATLSALNRDQEAAKWYEQLLKASIKNPQVFYNYGNTLRRLGRNLEAINAYKSALNLRPLFPAAYNNMGNALIELGHVEQAQTCYENALEIDPNNERAIRHLAQTYVAALKYKSAGALYQRLLALHPGDVDALLGVTSCLVSEGDKATAIRVLEQFLQANPSAPAPQFLLDAFKGESRDSAPREYTQGLFDGYAKTFEKDLTEKLEYRIPTKLRELLSEVVPGALQYANVLDIGCGTGLSGEAFHSISTRLTGIDLSPAMLVKAGEKGLYDNLLAGDAVELIRNSTETFDLVISCDALPYMGDLVPLFTAVATVTAAGGHFLCTTELASGESYSLQTTARFAHSPQYLLECASAAGFDALAQDSKPLRKEKSEWITGGLYCFVRRS